MAVLAMQLALTQALVVVHTQALAVVHTQALVVVHTQALVDPAPPGQAEIIQTPGIDQILTAVREQRRD